MTRNTKFDCIEKYVKKTTGTRFYEHTNSVVMWRDNIKNYWQFYNDNRWIKVVGNSTMETGNWQCDGEDGFIIISINGKTWKTRDPTWKDTPKPTEKPEQTSEPEADDSFPLKVGKEGPNVVKLQKFLNDKIPSNPLTVNGKFDEKTKNKLIEYQKKEGIIE